MDTQRARLVIFDLDGTLVDSLDDLTDAVNYMLSTFGRSPLGREGVRGMVGRGARNLVERSLPGGSREEIEAGLSLFIDYNERHIADKSRLYAGVAGTLEELARRRTTLAVVSNKNVDLCRRLLSALGVAGRFAAILGADSMPERKPSPAPLLHLLGEFAVPPGEAVIVGDSINDMEAGRGAGVATIACSYGYGGEEELNGADYRVESFPELLALPPFAP